LKDFKIRLDYELIESWKILVVENSILVNPLKKFDIVKDDLDDNKFFEAAVEGKADFIISQDKHLLKIGEFQRIKVLKPVDFLKLFHNKNKK
jgi:putative PIN family toxin of toxin-antitoxin system